ncbi:MAG: hypothetical protein CMO32_12075, partial [Variovorax sp.]|nr:hypothetical protein [Variovorax sp.]
MSRKANRCEPARTPNRLEPWMTDSQSPSSQVEQARELFFVQGRDPEPWIAPHISRSWRRSRPVDPRG